MQNLHELNHKNLLNVAVCRGQITNIHINLEGAKPKRFHKIT